MKKDRIELKNNELEDVSGGNVISAKNVVGVTNDTNIFDIPEEYQEKEFHLYTIDTNKRPF